MAPHDYVSDYESLLGEKPPEDAETKKRTKVITPKTPEVEKKA